LPLPVALTSILLAVWLCLPLRVSANVYHLTPADDWFSVLSNNRLEPGDEVVLGGGIYSDSRKLKLWQQGTAQQPIVIRSADGERAIITRPNAQQNVVNIEGGQHLVLRGLEITGGSAGIRLGGGLEGQPNFGDPARFVTIEDSVVHDVGDVAISANFAGQQYEGMIFRRNEIYNTGGVGEGFYLGCNDNACQFFDGLIEGNYIHHLNGPRVTQGDGIEIKHGSHDNIVRDNVIHDTGFPGIIAYGTAGNGGRNIIERNVIWGGREQGIQVAADAIVQNNIVFSNVAESFLSQNHQGATPGDLTIVHNTFVADRAAAVRISDPATSSIVIANNAIYARGVNAIRLNSTDQVTLSNNVGEGRTSPLLDASQFNSSGNNAMDLLDVDWRGPGRDAYPTAASALIESGNPAFAALDDFNGLPRTGIPDVGAYDYRSSGNPGWQVTSGFKRTVIRGDFNSNGLLDAADIDLLTETVRAATHAAPFDLNADTLVDQADRTIWINELAKTWNGDANLDGQFNSQDIVQVFAAGKYERGLRSEAVWAEGDWDGNGAFESHDLVVAFQDGGYEVGAVRQLATAVAEPSPLGLLGMASAAVYAGLHRRSSVIARGRFAP
jgi:hypothetical protein